MLRNPKDFWRRCFVSGDWLRICHQCKGLRLPNGHNIIGTWGRAISRSCLASNAQAGVPGLIILDRRFTKEGRFGKFGFGGRSSGCYRYLSFGLTGRSCFGLLLSSRSCCW
jgi:hypothetical protein